MQGIKVGDDRLRENKGNSIPCCKGHTRNKAKNNNSETSLKIPNEDDRNDLADNKLRNEDRNNGGGDKILPQAYVSSGP